MGQPSGGSSHQRELKFSKTLLPSANALVVSGRILTQLEDRKFV
jgi:hypothetical protein